MVKAVRGDGPARVTLRAVAREAGISIGTVSMALSRDPRVAESTRERVAAAAVRLGYVYDRGAATPYADVHPVGAVTKGLAGQELAEIGLMARSRAKVGTKPISKNGSASPRPSIRNTSIPPYVGPVNA